MVSDKDREMERNLYRQPQQFVGKPKLTVVKGGL